MRLKILVVTVAAVVAAAFAPAAMADVGDFATGSGARAGSPGCAPLPFSFEAVGGPEATATGTFSFVIALSAWPEPCYVFVPYSGVVLCLDVSGNTAFILGQITAGPESRIGQAVRFTVVDNSATGEPDQISGVTFAGPLDCAVRPWDPFSEVTAGDIVVRDANALTPIQAIEDLIVETGNAGSAANVHSMVTKLEGAVAALGRGETDAACGKIGAFMNEVEAQRGKKLTPEEADALLAAARAARTTAGCS